MVAIFILKLKIFGMNEWMNEWMNQWMNEWMNEWMNDMFIFLLSMVTFIMRNNVSNKRFFKLFYFCIHLLGNTISMIWSPPVFHLSQYSVSFVISSVGDNNIFLFIVTHTILYMHNFFLCLLLFLYFNFLLDVSIRGIWIWHSKIQSHCSCYSSSAGVCGQFG